MKCPDEIAKILLEIIYVGLLNIRGAANVGDAARCHSEADHIHDLPQMLMNYHPDWLKYYWRNHRANFIEDSRGKGLERFEPLWDELKPFVERIG